jgi:hypothetical protein
MKIVIEPATRVAEQCHPCYRPFHGLPKIAGRDPGACAPGFTLTPASQAM